MPEDIETICFGHLKGHDTCKIDELNQQCPYGYRPVFYRIFEVVETREQAKKQEKFYSKAG